MQAYRKHTFFLTTRSVYVLVLNGRGGGEDADAEYWLRLIDSFGAGSPVIVVLNKIKEQPFEINRRALQRRVSSQLFFVRIDCEDGTGIENLRVLISEAVSTHLPIHTIFPSSWFAIKHRLETATHNFITFDRYRAICAELGEHDPDNQEQLSDFLHCLGTVLNYRDDPRLRDTHVLNPHWITRGIYRIINSDAVQLRKGEITLRESAEVLPGSEYPAGMRRFLFDLMKKFELCFSFPEDDCHYLIPELLDKEEPETLPSFQPGCLRFRYRYDVLPEGLLPRFIVRTHALSEGSPRWRSGVVLRFEGNTALIRADAERRTIDVEVGGRADGQKQLLAIVRADFEKIHKDISRLSPNQLVPIPGAPEAEIPYEDLRIWETEGRTSYAVRVGSSVVEMPVEGLLNEVDLPETRERDQGVPAPTALRVFISYSHKDERFLNELSTHLKLLQRRGSIECWHDRQIRAGDEWRGRIDENLEQAHVVLFLVSADFLASDYCYDIEVKRALERHAASSACLIPVIVRDVNWNSATFSHIQALPKDGRPVVGWPGGRDSAWRAVAEGIEAAIKSYRLSHASV